MTAPRKSIPKSSVLRCISKHLGRPAAASRGDALRFKAVDTRVKIVPRDVCQRIVRCAARSAASSRFTRPISPPSRCVIEHLANSGVCSRSFFIGYLESKKIRIQAARSIQLSWRSKFQIRSLRSRSRALVLASAFERAIAALNATMQRRVRF